MPEGVEVCLTSLFLNNILAGKELKNIKVLSGRYKKTKLKGLDKFNKIKKFNIKKVNSKGKLLWFVLSNNANNKNDDINHNFYIFNHFGMTGEWGLTKQNNSRVMLTIEDINKNSIFNIYYTDDRNFGTIYFSNSKSDLQFELNKLAPDFLKEQFNNKDFSNRIKYYLDKSNNNKNKEIVKVLIDQKAIGSSLGTYLVAEILFDAKISPYKKLIDIFEDVILSDTLAESIKYIIKMSYLTSDIGYLSGLEPQIEKFIHKLRTNIYNNPQNKYNFLPDVIIKKNDIFEFKIYRKNIDSYGNLVLADKNLIKNRTIYWSPEVQN